MYEKKKEFSRTLFQFLKLINCEYYTDILHNIMVIKNKLKNKQ